MNKPTFDELKIDISHLNYDLEHATHDITKSILLKELINKKEQLLEQAQQGYYSEEHWEKYKYLSIRLALSFPDSIEEEEISEEMHVFCNENLIPAQIKRMNQRWDKIQENELANATTAGVVKINN
ncbi:hypothetical protein bcgnr5372_26580 [Bacillus luti]|nr:hypothetical protein [Bacillus cereus]HDR8331361.1 hypothetical protein [Bacillus cereus]HDR8335947.1 hypothetical protein [Bacillus cereus]